MLDYRLKPVLIEVNTNPCLALVAPLLFRVIPQMVDGALRIVLDSLFPELQIARKAVDSLPENRWELIFHELVDGKALHRALQSRGSLPLLQASDSFFYDSSSSDNTEGPGH
jgi:tubulin polyglutamylase TTLL1/tubulin monoglycylase TTLL3/8